MSKADKSQNKPCKVIQVKNIDQNVNEAIIADYFQTLCEKQKVVKVLYSKNQSQAFIEFDEIEGAEKIVNFSKVTNLQMNGKSLSINWSDRNHITNATPLATYRKKIIDENDITTERLVPKNLVRPGTIIFIKITDIKFMPNLNEIYTIFIRYGDIDKILLKNISQEQFWAFVQFAHKNSADNAIDETNMRCMQDDCNLMNVSLSYIDFISIQNAEEQMYQSKEQDCFDIIKPKDELAVAQVDSKDQYNIAKSPVILLTRLPVGVTVDEIFNVFSICGYISKIKIFYKNKESALVEYSDRDGAERAKDTFNNLPFRNSLVNVQISNKGPVNFDTSNSLNKIFEHTNLNRFKEVNHIYSKTLSPPSRILHISNLDDNMEEKDILSFLNELVEVEGFKWLKEGKSRMCLAKMPSVSEAVEVIAKFHNEHLKGKSIKISFSKNSL